MHRAAPRGTLCRMSLHRPESVAAARRLAIAVVLALCAGVHPAAVFGTEGRTLASVELTAAQVVDVARNLIAAGKLNQADTLLSQLERDAAGGEERRFLQGMLALASNDYARAETLFRAMLDRDPSLLRVRLELARVLFLQHDDPAADYHFRLALAGQPPATVVQTVNGYRQIIRNRRAWRFDFGIGIAPDTNINGATNRQRVSILGLPFELDDDARASSGIGLAVNAEGSYRFRRETRMPVYVGAYGRSIRYGRSEFDDEYVGLDAGPEFNTRFGRLRAAMTAGTRWYGKETYNDSLGMRLLIESPVATRWGFGGSVEFRALHHPQRPFLDGHTYDLNLSLSRVLGPATLGNVWAGAQRKTAAVDAYSSRTVRLGGGISHELGWSLRLGLGAEAARTLYDQPLGIFADRRKDSSAFAYVSVAKRDFRIAGFTPTLRMSYAATASTIDLYRSTRWRAEVALLRTF